MCHRAPTHADNFFYSCLRNTTIELARVRCGKETAQRNRLFTLTALAVAEPTGGEVPYETRTKLTVASLIRLDASAGKDNKSVLFGKKKIMTNCKNKE